MPGEQGYIDDKNQSQVTDDETREKYDNGEFVFKKERVGSESTVDDAVILFDVRSATQNEECDV